MKLFRRIFFGLLAILVLLSLSIVIYLNHQRPIYEGVVSDVLLKQNVEVFFDSYGIPHIYGESKVDAYKVLGYLHAQDRLFQMDLMRRVGAGRLSEIFGEELIDADKFYRTLGIAEKSKSDLSLIKEKIKGSEQEQIINAYLEGVNTFIEEGAWPVEYRLLGVEPELFTMLNMFETAGYMAYSFAFTIRTEPAVDFCTVWLTGPEAQNAWKITWMAQGQAQNAKTALQGGQKAACIYLNRLYSIIKVLSSQPDQRSGIIHLSKYES